MLMQRYQYRFKALGTKITLTVFQEKDQQIFLPSQQLVERYEKQFSIYRPNSEISIINRLAGQREVRVSSGTFDLTRLAREISLKNWGFNIAIGPLVKEWNIGFKDAHVPSQKRIDALLEIIDPTKIILNEQSHTVMLADPYMQLDLGGIAKGYIADRLQDLWHAFGIKVGMINLGGNLLTVGPCPLHPDHQWRIGIQNPWKVRGESLRVDSLPACSAVTSGIYERNFTSNGQFYHHIFDPQTGYPVKNDLMSVTVFTDESVWGEIESTHLFFNPKITLTEAQKDPHFIGAVFVYQNHEIRILGI